MPSAGPEVWLQLFDEFDEVGAGFVNRKEFLASCANRQTKSWSSQLQPLANPDKLILDREEFVTFINSTSASGPRKLKKYEPKPGEPVNTSQEEQLQAQIQEMRSQAERNLNREIEQLRAQKLRELQMEMVEKERKMMQELQNKQAQQMKQAKPIKKVESPQPAQPTQIDSADVVGSLSNSVAGQLEELRQSLVANETQRQALHKYEQQVEAYYKRRYAHLKHHEPESVLGHNWDVETDPSAGLSPTPYRSPLRKEKLPEEEPQVLPALQAIDVNQSSLKRYCDTAAQRSKFWLQRLNSIPLDADTREARRELSVIRLQCDEQEKAWEQLFFYLDKHGPQSVCNKLKESKIETIDDSSVVQIAEEFFPRNLDTPTREQIKKLPSLCQSKFNVWTPDVPWIEHLNPSKFWKAPESITGFKSPANKKRSSPQRDVMSASDFLRDASSSDPPAAQSADDFLQSLESRNEPKEENTPKSQQQGRDWFVKEQSADDFLRALDKRQEESRVQEQSGGAQQHSDWFASEAPMKRLPGQGPPSNGSTPVGKPSSPPSSDWFSSSPPRMRAREDDK